MSLRSTLASYEPCYTWCPIPRLPDPKPLSLSIPRSLLYRTPGQSATSSSSIQPKPTWLHTHPLLPLPHPLPLPPHGPSGFPPITQLLMAASIAPSSIDPNPLSTLPLSFYQTNSIPSNDSYISAIIELSYIHVCDIYFEWYRPRHWRPPVTRELVTLTGCSCANNIPKYGHRSEWKKKVPIVSFNIHNESGMTQDLVRKSKGGGGESWTVVRETTSCK